MGVGFKLPFAGSGKQTDDRKPRLLATPFLPDPHQAYITQLYAKSFSHTKMRLHAPPTPTPTHPHKKTQTKTPTLSLTLVTHIHT